MNLSPHFTLEELERSDTAARLGIGNRIPGYLLDNARELAQLLERIRDFLSQRAGREIRIDVTSGYRCDRLNAAVGGQVGSDHLRARAADFRAPDFGTPVQIAAVLAPAAEQLGIGQLINEFPPAGWVHVSTARPARDINRVITLTRRGVAVGIVETLA